MKVVLLAAGLGSRLRPHTDEVPKALVPLFNKPLLEHQLEVLKSAGLQDIVIATGYKAERLKPYGNTIHNKNYQHSNMVTSLFCAETLFADSQDLLIAYTDIVYSLPVLESLLSSKADITIAADRDWLPYWQARMDDPLSDAESFKIDKATGLLLELGKTAESLEDIEAQYMGLIKISKTVLQDVIDVYHAIDKQAIYDGKNFDNMYMTSFLQILIDRGFSLMPDFCHRGWIEVDTVEDLALYHTMQTLESALNIGI